MRPFDSRPTVSALVNPTLAEVDRLGGVAATRDIDRGVVERLSTGLRSSPFSTRELSLPLSYVRTYLKIGGLLEQPAAGIWELAPGLRHTEIEQPEEIVRLSERWYRGGRDRDAIVHWRTERTGREIFDPMDRITAVLVRAGGALQHPLLPGSRAAYDEVRALLRKWAPELDRHLKAGATSRSTVEAMLA